MKSETNLLENANEKGGRNKKIGTELLVKFFNKYLPDAFAIAILLTIIIFVAGIAFTPASAFDMVSYFGKGFPNLYSFGMQMALILVTGHALANTKQVKKILNGISSIPKNPTQAVVFISIACMILNYINWGLGMIGGAMLAKQVAIKNRKTHYPLLIALVYGATMIRGFSTSIPLVVATPGHFLEKSLGVIPISKTMFSSWNMIISVGLVILLALLAKLMMPPENEILSIPEHLIKEDEIEVVMMEADATPAQKFSHSKILSLFISIVVIIYCIDYFIKADTFNINIDIVIILFMAIGIFLHGSLVSYKNAIGKAIKVTSGVILQFPIYAGIMAMIRNSDIASMISQWFVSISTSGSFPVVTFISASILNIFVPSGGGQWAVQGPIMMPAAAELGADTAKTIMAIAWGDALTNQIQPFWALPILGVAGLEVKDIMGYCAAWCLVAGIFIGIVLAVL